jgi:phospholipid/cholesterol/gamma-HCH transport system substrate-binding protein
VDGLIVSARGNVERIASNANHITADLRQITAGVRHGQGVAGQLLTNQAVASNIDATIAQVRQTSTNAEQASSKIDAVIANFQQKDLGDIHQTLSNTSHMTGQLDQAFGTFLAKGNNNQNTAVALRNTVHDAQQAVTNFADDTEAVKHNFFLRGFFHRRGFYNLSDLTPKKYDSTKFVRKARARVWIPAAGLFTTGSDGTQTLTDVGRSILNQSMSDLVPFLPNDPVVIEGYAANGLPGQLYLESRQRALDVRQYLEWRFHLKSELLGIMPLGDHPPPGTGKTTWDGICLALVVSK